MAVVTKYGFTETALLMTGGTATAWASMALGTGSAADATTLSALATELTNSGLERVAAATVTVAASDATNDTCKFVHTWTASASKNVKECGVFNSSAAGDMLCYGTFTSAIPMESDDTLKVTWSVTVKAG